MGGNGKYSTLSDSVNPLLQAGLLKHSSVRWLLFIPQREEYKRSVLSLLLNTSYMSNVYIAAGEKQPDP